ncbi:MAG: lysophospholipid acyltransferase family protein [Candidatus Omnitrophota bacterium]
MVYLRCLYRITALALWLVFACLISVPYQFSGWEGNRKISRIVRLWARGVARILNLKIKKYGEMPSLQRGLVVSNHLGYIDIITHGTLFPSRFTSTTVIARWPVIGWIISLTRPVWVDRGYKPASKKASRDFIKTMRRGMCLIVYPEGTSTDGKGGILDFKSTAFEAAVSGNMPVLPVLTLYKEKPGEKTVCWYGDMTLFPHIWEVLKRPSIEAELYFLDAIFPEGRSRKELASFVHGRMSEEYEKLTRRACERECRNDGAGIPANER